MEDQELISAKSNTTHSTGSRYKGTFNNQKRMHGYGVFHFPTGTRYEGNFKDGMFHGQGTLYFQDGAKFESTWDNGRCLGPEEPSGSSTDAGYTFADGLKYQSIAWDYCSVEDRRFHTERCNEILPAGKTQLTDNLDDVDIPIGWYDCGDGLYNPNKRVVYTYKDNKFLRNADIEEHEWIVNTCRRGVTKEEQLDPVTKLYKIPS